MLPLMAASSALNKTSNKIPEVQLGRKPLLLLLVALKFYQLNNKSHNLNIK